MPAARLSASARRYVVEFVVVAAAYALASQASLAFRLAGTNVSLVWLPAGIAVAAMLLRGSWLWTVVPVAQTLVTLDQGAFNALRVTAATTVGVLVTYGVLRQLRFAPSLTRRRDALAVITASAAGGLVGALINGGLRVVERGVTGDAVHRMLNWWLGDVTGTLLVVPLACTWLTGTGVSNLGTGRARRTEAGILAGLLALIGGLMPFAFPVGATPLLGLLYLAVPLEMWAAVRFGPRGGAQAFGVTAGAVLLSSLVPVEPSFAGEPVSLTVLDGFLIVSAAATLVVASLVAEHTGAVGALAESRRVETVRRLAAGVAHDFNNLLTVILAHVNIIRTGRADGSDLDAIQEATMRAASLTQQLLSYGQQTLLRPAVFDVNPVVRDLHAALGGGAALPRGVTLELSLAEGLPAVRTDRDQLSRVLEQLCLRGAKATPAGGRVRVTTTVVGGGGRGPGRGVAIGVTDGGPPPPVAAEARGRLFEPYPGELPTGDWTARPSGLELAMAHGFAHQVGGQITVAGDPGGGGGTIITIVLPAAN